MQEKIERNYNLVLKKYAMPGDIILATSRNSKQMTGVLMVLTVEAGLRMHICLMLENNSNI